MPRGPTVQNKAKLDTKVYLFHSEELLSTDLVIGSVGSTQILYFPEDTSFLITESLHLLNTFHFYSARQYARLIPFVLIIS